MLFLHVIMENLVWKFFAWMWGQKDPTDEMRKRNYLSGLNGALVAFTILFLLSAILGTPFLFKATKGIVDPDECFRDEDDT